MPLLRVMHLISRCCAVIALLAPWFASETSVAAANTAGSTTETLAVTFLTPSLGWRATDRWDPNAGARDR